MQKIFILGLLLTPIMAHAARVVDDHPNFVGPWAALGTPVVATANAPYATATAENGDTTNVVSASYVKGAYNDAIAAVNKVATYVDGLEDAKQNRLQGSEGREYITKEVFDNGSGGLGGELIGWDNETYAQVREDIADMLGAANSNPNYGLINAGAVFDIVRDAGTVLKSNINSKRVNAVTTWGNDNATQLGLSNAQ